MCGMVCIAFALRAAFLRCVLLCVLYVHAACVVVLQVICVLVLRVLVCLRA